MADTQTTTRELVIENYFVDGDTRNQTLKNPKTTIGSSDIQALNNYCQVNQPIIGDKSGAAFGRINKATVKVTQRRTLDLTVS